MDLEEEVQWSEAFCSWWWDNKEECKQFVRATVRSTQPFYIETNHWTYFLRKKPCKPGRCNSFAGTNTLPKTNMESENTPLEGLVGIESFGVSAWPPSDSPPMAWSTSRRWSSRWLPLLWFVALTWEVDGGGRRMGAFYSKWTFKYDRKKKNNNKNNLVHIYHKKLPLTSPQNSKKNIWSLMATFWQKHLGGGEVSCF